MFLQQLTLALCEQFVAHSIQSFVISTVLSLLLYIVGNEVIRHRVRVPGIKGPRGLPLIGNLWDIRRNAAEKYYEWSKTYGEVYQVQMGNVPIVVVNSAAAAKNLFISHSQALSSRPTTYTFHKVASSTAGLTIGTSPYDESLKRRKKGAAVALNRPAVQSYIPYLDIETRTFISDLLTHGKAGKVPINPLPFIQRLSLSLATTINWGVRVPSHEDPLFKEIVEVEEELNRFRSTTGNLQDYIPLLRINPINLASAKAREMRGRRDRYLHKFNSDLADKVEKGTNKPCIQANVIKFKEAVLTEVELTSISLSMLSGGFETVSTTVQWSMGYVAQHPEIQDRAFEAIREFQGTADDPKPLCDAIDDHKCAYVAAMAKEALRYFTVIPLNLPRESIKDIEYDGVLVPKGTTVYMNAWACNYDHDLWEDPEVFRPERWLEKPNSPVFTFGLGYRMCAGHVLANREVYLIFMRMLSSFRLEPYGTANCDPKHGFKNPEDLIMAPNAYKVLCVPRNEALLRHSLTAEMKEE